jgi:MFS family permease
MTNSKLKLFLTAELLSSASDQFKAYAVPLAIYSQTGNVAYTGIAVFLEWFPRLISSMLSGPLCDKWTVKKVFLLSTILRAIICLLGYFLLSDVVLLLIAALVSYLNGQAFVALETSIPKLFKDKLEFASAQAKFQSIDQFSRVAGPALAALITTSSFVRIQDLILISGVGFLLSFLVYLRINLSLTHSTSHPSSIAGTFKDIAKGFAFILKDARTRMVVLMSIMLNFNFGVFSGVAPELVLKNFQMPDEYLGYMYSIAGIATVIATLFASALLRRLHIRTYGIISAISLTISALVLASSHNYYWLAIGYSMWSIGTAYFSIYLRTERAQIIPPQDFGKIIGVFISLMLSSIPLAGLFVSLMAGILHSKEILLLGLISSMVGFFISYFNFESIQKKMNRLNEI